MKTHPHPMDQWNWTLENFLTIYSLKLKHAWTVGCSASMTLEWKPQIPGHFLIGCPIEALTDMPSTYNSISLLCHFQHCQELIPHIQKHWSTEHMSCLQKVPNGIYTRRMSQQMMFSLCMMIGCYPPSGHWHASLKYSLARTTLYMWLNWRL